MQLCTLAHWSFSDGHFGIGSSPTSECTGNVSHLCPGILPEGWRGAISLKCQNLLYCQASGMKWQVKLNSVPCSNLYYSSQIARIRNAVKTNLLSTKRGQVPILRAGLGIWIFSYLIRAKSWKKLYSYL